MIRLARDVPLPRVSTPGISEEGRAFLESQGKGRYTGRSYRIVSLEMHSPLVVVLEIPKEAVLFFGFALLALAERVATSQTRVSRKRARDLRDKAVHDRERMLIEEGRLDLAFLQMRRHAKPDVIEIVGGDEDFEDAEPFEMGLLKAPEDDPPTSPGVA